MNRQNLVLASSSTILLALISLLLLSETSGVAQAVPIFSCVPASDYEAGEGVFNVCKGDYVMPGADCVDVNTKKCSDCRVVVIQNGTAVECYSIWCSNNQSNISYKNCYKDSNTTTKTCHVTDVKSVNCGMNCKANRCGPITGNPPGCTVGNPACPCEEDGNAFTITATSTQVNTCTTN